MNFQVNPGDPSYTGDFVFEATCTYYRAKPGAVTASGNNVDPEKVRTGKHRWIAVSRDLHEYLEFGDTVQIMSSTQTTLSGEWVVYDLMHPRWKRKIDFLVYPGTQLWSPHKVIVKKKNKRKPGTQSP